MLCFLSSIFRFLSWLSFAWWPKRSILSFWDCQCIDRKIRTEAGLTNKSSKKRMNKQQQQQLNVNEKRLLYIRNVAVAVFFCTLHSIQECILKFLNVTCVVCGVVAGTGDTSANQITHRTSSHLAPPLSLCEWTSNTLGIVNVFVLSFFFFVRCYSPFGCWEHDFYYETRQKHVVVTFDRTRVLMLL